MAKDAIFERLTFGAWRQFASIDIKFHRRLTVVTGTNGVGKSTLLNILSRHFGVERPYLSVPQVDREGLLSYVPGLRHLSAFLQRVWSAFRESRRPGQIGMIRYANGMQASLSVPNSGNVTYSLDISPNEPVLGLHIGSHRLLSRYWALEELPVRGTDPDSAAAAIIRASNAQHLGEYEHYRPLGDWSFLFQLKKAIVSWKVFGFGGGVLQPIRRQQEAFNGLVEIFQKVLPPEIGFRGIEIRPPEVVLTTDSGEFLIDAASGGIAKLLELSSIIYMFSIQTTVQGRPFVVVLDEPENHLHPSLQRTLLNNLLVAFPTAQFVVATHSPFIVSSVRDSSIYVLRFATDVDSSPSRHRVETAVVSELLDHVNRAGTALAVLREVLGVPNTLPTWVEDELRGIVERYTHREVSESILQELKHDLRRAGLDELFPDALVELSRRQ